MHEARSDPPCTRRRHQSGGATPSHSAAALLQRTKPLAGPLHCGTLRLPRFRSRAGFWFGNGRAKQYYPLTVLLTTPSVAIAKPDPRGTKRSKFSRRARWHLQMRTSSRRHLGCWRRSHRSPGAYRWGSAKTAYPTIESFSVVHQTNTKQKVEVLPLPTQSGCRHGRAHCSHELGKAWASRSWLFG